MDTSKRIIATFLCLVLMGHGLPATLVSEAQLSPRSQCAGIFDRQALIQPLAEFQQPREHFPSSVARQTADQRLHSEEGALHAALAPAGKTKILAWVLSLILGALAFFGAEIRSRAAQTLSDQSARSAAQVHPSIDWLKIANESDLQLLAAVQQYLRDQSPEHILYQVDTSGQNYRKLSFFQKEHAAAWTVPYDDLTDTSIGLNIKWWIDAKNPHRFEGGMAERILLHELYHIQNRIKNIKLAMQIAERMAKQMGNRNQNSVKNFNRVMRLVSADEEVKAENYAMERCRDIYGHLPSDQVVKIGLEDATHFVNDFNSQFRAFSPAQRKIFEEMLPGKPVVLFFLNKNIPNRSRPNGARRAA